MTVILKHMFEPGELVESPALKDELETDIRSECGKLGKVDKVRVWAGWPGGGSQCGKRGLVSRCPVPPAPLPCHLPVTNTRTRGLLLSCAAQLRVFAAHPQGVVSVKFTTLEAADECVRVMNGRFFGGRQLEAAKWDGFTNFNVKVQWAAPAVAAAPAGCRARMARRLAASVAVVPAAASGLRAVTCRACGLLPDQPAACPAPGPERCRCRRVRRSSRHGWSGLRGSWRRVVRRARSQRNSDPCLLAPVAAIAHHSCNIDPCAMPAA